MFECCSDTLCMSGKPGCPPEQSYHSYVTCLFLLFLKVVLSDLPFSQGVVFFFAELPASYCSMHAHLFFHIHILLAYARTHTPSHVPQSRSHAHTIQCYCRDRVLFLLSLGIFRRSMPSNTLCMVCSEIKIITSFAREHGLKPCVCTHGPVCHTRRHRSHHFVTQPSHSVGKAGWQAKMASIEFRITWRNAHDHKVNGHCTNKYPYFKRSKEFFFISLFS